LETTKRTGLGGTRGEIRRGSRERVFTATYGERETAVTEKTDRIRLGRKVEEGTMKERKKNTRRSRKGAFGNG